MKKYIVKRVKPEPGQTWVQADEALRRNVLYLSGFIAPRTEMLVIEAKSAKEARAEAEAIWCRR